MSRKESIVIGYAITATLALITCLVLIASGQSDELINEEPDIEAVVIDGDYIPMVYGDDGAPYLKYVIGEQNIYIPLPVEPDTQDSDSLKFYNVKNGKQWQKMN